MKKNDKNKITDTDPPKEPPKPPKKYEKPTVKIHEPLDELTFVTGTAAAPAGVVVSGGGV